MHRTLTKAMNGALTAAAVLSCTAALGAERGPHRFEEFATTSYSGPRKHPDFSGKARHYREFRTNISKGFAEGRPFAGHYVLFAIGCGASCVSYTLGDVTTGHIYDFPLGGEDNFALHLQFRPNSSLVKAYWMEDGSSTSCQTQELVWDGTRFRQFAVRVMPGRCPEAD